MCVCCCEMRVKVTEIGIVGKQKSVQFDKDYRDEFIDSRNKKKDHCIVNGQESAVLKSLIKIQTCHSHDSEILAKIQKFLNENKKLFFSSVQLKEIELKSTILLMFVLVNYKSKRNKMCTSAFLKKRIGEAKNGCLKNI